MQIKQLSIFILCINIIGCDQSENTHYQGYVENENIYLASPYSGLLIKKLAKRGQGVKKGDLLFKLDENPELLIVKQNEAELLQAKKIYDDLAKPRRKQEITAIEAQIAQTNAQLSLAALRVKRTQELYKKHVIDKDSADEAQARYEELNNLKLQFEANLELAREGSREEQLNAQQAQINALISKLKQAKWQLAQKSLYAPANGVIFDTYYLEGEFVANQRPIASLMSPDNLRIEFFVPARDLTNLHVGQKISFTCEGCMPRNFATISYISKEAEYIPPLVYTSNNIDKLVFRIKAPIEKPSRYKPGQPVTITGLHS